MKVQHNSILQEGICKDSETSVYKTSVLWNGHILNKGSFIKVIFLRSNLHLNSMEWNRTMLLLKTFFTSMRILLLLMWNFQGSREIPIIAKRNSKRNIKNKYWVVLINIHSVSVASLLHCTNKEGCSSLMSRPIKKFWKKQ